MTVVDPNAQAASDDVAPAAQTDPETPAVDADPATPAVEPETPAEDKKVEPEVPAASEEDDDEEEDETDETEAEQPEKSPAELLASLQKANSKNTKLVKANGTLKTERDAATSRAEKAETKVRELTVTAEAAQRGLEPRLTLRALDPKALEIDEDGSIKNLTEVLDALEADFPNLRVATPQVTSPAGGNTSRFDRINPEQMTADDLRDPEKWRAYQRHLAAQNSQ